MAKEHKIWNKIKSKPYRADIKSSDLDYFLRKIGYKKVRQQGSHAIYKHPDDEFFIDYTYE